MKLTLLGTGTPAPSLTRQGSGYLIDVGCDVLVFDHGPGAHHRLIEGGRRATEVSRAFFTHLHYDHCMDYARLVLQRWDQGAGRIPDLEVYGPAPIAYMSTLLFSDAGVYGPDLRARVEHQSSLDVFEARGGHLRRHRRYGTIAAVGGSMAALASPLMVALLLCAIGAATSAFASSAAIIGVMIPLAAPLMTQGAVDATGMAIALALSATLVDATPFSTVGALVVANAHEGERPHVYRGLLVWGASMVVVAPLLTSLVFVVLGW